MKERLQKIIRDAGLGSRREVEKWIVEGRIKVNGLVINELGFRANLENDDILVNEQPIKKEKKVYYLFNKPAKVITTLKDPEGRKTIANFFEEVPERVFPIGRLDYETEGLLIVTNDGDLMNQLIHPSYEIPKKYMVLVSGILSEENRKKIETGVMLREGITAPAICEIIDRKIMKKKTLLELTIREGRNRQVRRMMEQVGHSVLSLSRIQISFLGIGNLKSGEYRSLEKSEVARLKNIKY